MRAMSIATVIVALAGYAIVTIAAQALDKPGYEAFMVYWSLFFMLTGLLDGLMQESARAVTAAKATSPAQHTARPFALTGAIAGVVGAIIVLTGFWWAPIIAPDSQAWGIGLMLVGLVSYTFQATVCGLLSAAQQWKSFAWLISVDSVVRLVLAAIAWVLGWQLLAFFIVTVLGAATWLLALILSPSTRSLLPSRADVATKAFLRRVVQAMVASGANAVLITGFTVLLKFTTDSTTAQGALGATITAVTLTRAPILVPLQRFQPALIVHFTENRHKILAAAAKPMAAVLALGIVGAIAAYFLAQPIMRIFFPEDLISAQWALAALTLASAGTALLMVTGSAALAADRHGLYSAGWIAATILAIVLLSVPASPEVRSILALGAAPLLGIIIHLIPLTRSAAPRKVTT